MVKLWCIVKEVVGIRIRCCYNHINEGRFLFPFKPMLGRFIFRSIEYNVVLGYCKMALSETWKSRFQRVKFCDKSADVISFHSNNCFNIRRGNHCELRATRYGHSTCNMLLYQHLWILENGSRKTTQQGDDRRPFKQVVNTIRRSIVRNFRKKREVAVNDSHYFQYTTFHSLYRLYEFCFKCHNGPYAPIDIRRTNNDVKS